MKKIMLSAILLALTITGFAQDNKYQDAMKKNIAMFDTARATETLQTLANNFERIATVKNDEWLPLYYSALSKVRLAFMQQDKAKIDPIVDAANSLANKADSLNPDKAEMLCLHSMIASARIAVDPQTRGMEYGPLSAQLLDQAAKAAPENPRVTLLKGQNAFYTPAQWGGGKEVAKPLLEKALQQFATFKPSGDLMPNWGKSLAEYMLAQCNQ